MVFRVILLTITIAMGFSGCVDEETPTPDSVIAQDTVPASRGASPPCTSISGNNYGIDVTVEDERIKVEGGRVFWYHESNGVRGTQTEETCPGNPDTKVFDEQVYGNSYAWALDIGY